MEYASKLPMVAVAVVALTMFWLAVKDLLADRLVERDYHAPVAKPLMTAREEAVMAALEILLPAHRIHAQVAMGALLMPPRKTARRKRHVARNAFSQKIVDFVVQDRTTGKVVALIEVDDRSHNVARDKKRDAMTDGAGYRTVRIPASAAASVADVMPFVAPLREPDGSSEYAHLVVAVKTAD